jgi:hypothetical protein
MALLGMLTCMLGLRASPLMHADAAKRMLACRECSRLV